MACAALHLTARLVKSRILKWLITTLASLSFSLSARPSARGGADTCSLCLVSSMQKKHLMHETDR